MDDGIENIIIKEVHDKQINLHYLSDKLKKLTLEDVIERCDCKFFKLPKKLEEIYFKDVDNDCLVKIRNKIKNLPFNTKVKIRYQNQNFIRKTIKLETVKEIDEFINGKFIKTNLLN
jgi:hypothetical protein